MNEVLLYLREDKIKLNKIRNSRKYVEEKLILVCLKGFEMLDKLVDGFEDDIRVNLERRYWNKVMDYFEKVCKEKKSELVLRLVRYGYIYISFNFLRLC